MITQINEAPKLKDDTKALLKRDIRRMQTLFELLTFISDMNLDVDTTNLQENFDAEQRAAAKPFELNPGGLAVAPKNIAVSSLNIILLGEGATVVAIPSIEIPVAPVKMGADISVNNEPGDFDAEQFAALQPSSSVSGGSALGVSRKQHVTVDADPMLAPWTVPILKTSLETIQGYVSADSWRRSRPNPTSRMIRALPLS